MSFFSWECFSNLKRLEVFHTIAKYLQNKGFGVSWIHKSKANKTSEDPMNYYPYYLQIMGQKWAKRYCSKITSYQTHTMGEMELAFVSNRGRTQGKRTKGKRSKFSL